jgi:uncharacterized DUF497 family protein
VTFQWDPAKARANLRRHRVDFADAATVFEDLERSHATIRARVRQYEEEP